MPSFLDYDSPKLFVRGVRIHFKLLAEVRVGENDGSADYLFNTFKGFLMDRIPSKAFFGFCFAFVVPHSPTELVSGATI